MTTNPKGILAERLEEADLSTTRFVDVIEGEKKCVDHGTVDPEAVAGNYGVYAEAKDELVILDIDDYDGLDDTSGLNALAGLPHTFQARSPHGGTHRYYKVEMTDGGRLPAARLEDVFGSQNLKPSWGEVRVANQYVVGPGSELDGCDKEWCEDCATEDGGRYTVHEDAEIACISADKLIHVLKEDPDTSLATPAADDGGAAPPTDADRERILEYARECNENLDRLWRGDYSKYGGDRSAAEAALAAHLAFWFQGDKRVVAELMDRANTKKWADRDDDSYRESILSVVDDVDEHYDPDTGRHTDPATFDPAELDRAEAILQSQTTPTSPAGELQEKNGCYVYQFEVYEDGELVDTKTHTVTNFTLETLEYLDTYEGEQLRIRVHPHHPQEDAYDVAVAPTVFNEPRTFKEEIVTGRTTRFENPPGRKTQQDVLNDLRETVGSQPAPTQQGTEYIGLHGDEYQEWVAPTGTLTDEGWTDEPAYTYYEKGGNQNRESALAEKWQLDPSDGASYDSAEVRGILEHLPETRRVERGLPIIGWFYAAPLKTYIQDWEGQFNHLQVTGGTGAGKTSEVGLLYQLFGGDSNPYGCGDTRFTIEKKLSSSCGFPIWLDEYKPADLGERQLDWLHRRLRELTSEQIISKGRSDLSEVNFRLRAPVVFSGEQTVQAPAVRRRTIMTNLAEPDADAVEAYSELVGASYTRDGEAYYPEQARFTDHALAYYQWILTQDEETLKTWWKESREQTQELLTRLRVPSLDDSEFQGLQTIAFGRRVYQAFAEAHDVDATAIPDEADLEAAFDHVVENIGPGGRRREHIDEFVELLTQAANAGYLDEGDTHRVLDSRSWDKTVLAFHMPTAFANVRKYVAEYNLEDYTLLGKSDYLDTLADKAEADGTYALATNKRVRGLDAGSKAVYLDPEQASAVLGDDFTLAAFTDQLDDTTDDADGEEDGDGGPPPIQSLSEDERYTTTIEARVASTVDPAPWLNAEGTLQDETGYIDYVARGGSWSLEQGGQYRLENVKVESEDGELRVELRDGVTEVTRLEAPSDQSRLPDSEAAADGGQALAGLKGRVHDAVIEAEEPVSVGTLAGRLDADPDEVAERLDDLSTVGRVLNREEGWVNND